MTQGTAGENSASVSPWDPVHHLKQIDSAQAKYSRGFLRSKPEKWFPGFAAQWLPLVHALGVEIKVTEVKPTLEVPDTLDIGYGGEVEGEQYAVLFDKNSARTIYDAVSPGALQSAREVVLEYLSRRFAGSLAAAWSGAEASKITFDTRVDPFRVPVAGAIRVSFVLNGQNASVWILLGRKMVERLDGLWRRQTQSSIKPFEGGGQIFIEIAQLAVPPSMIVDYTRSGTIIDLEVPVNETVTIRSGSKALFAGKLCNLGSNFGVEVLATPPQAAALPDGTTRLSIAIGKLQIDPATYSELFQPGVFWDTNIPIRETVEMIINGEKVADATLCTYEGRFAISVG